MRALFILGVVVLASGFAFGADPPSGRPDGGVGKPPWLRAGGLFQKFDANNDQMLTPEEVPAHLWNRLSAADSNKDAQVTIPEIAQTVSSKLMQRFDKNKDGALNSEEAPPAMWKHLSQADSNKNGRVTRAEFILAIVSRLTKKADPTPPNGRRFTPTRLFNNFDANKDGKLADNEVPAMVWQRLRAADSNGDGMVTLTEVQAHLKSQGVE